MLSTMMTWYRAGDAPRKADAAASGPDARLAARPVRDCAEIAPAVPQRRYAHTSRFNGMHASLSESDDVAPALVHLRPVGLPFNCQNNSVNLGQQSTRGTWC